MLTNRIFLTHNTESERFYFSSTFTFINYYPELVEDASIMRLFESTSYKNEINKICSAGYKLDQTKEMVFHPLQINIVMMPPGQDLPLHQVCIFRSYFKLFYGISENSRITNGSGEQTRDQFPIGYSMLCLNLVCGLTK